MKDEKSQTKTNSPMPSDRATGRYNITHAGKGNYTIELVKSEPMEFKNGIFTAPKTGHYKIESINGELISATYLGEE